MGLLSSAGILWHRGHGDIPSWLGYNGARSTPLILVVEAVTGGGLVIMDNASPCPKSGTVLPFKWPPAWSSWGWMLDLGNFLLQLFSHGHHSLFLFCMVANLHSSSGLCDMVWGSTTVCPAKSNSLSSIYTNYLSCSICTPPFNCKMELLKQDLFLLSL